jgi:hypothetical protein
LGADFMGLGETFLNGEKRLDRWITEKSDAPYPIMDALNKLHVKLDEIEDLSLVIRVTEREDNLGFF